MADSIGLLKQLDEKELLIYNAEIQKVRKSTGVAYLLYFFFGGIGAHKFYLGQPGWGCMYILGAVSVLIGMGLPPVLVLALPWSIALFIDLFTIPGQNRKLQEKEGDKIAQRLLATRS